MNSSSGSTSGTCFRTLGRADLSLVPGTALREQEKDGKRGNTMKEENLTTIDIVVRGLWLQYYGLKTQSAGKKFPLENGAVLAPQRQVDEEFSQPAGFMVAD